MAATRKRTKKKPRSAVKASFIDSMECLPVTKIPEGPEWTYEIKLDGYRLEAVKTKGTLRFTPVAETS